MFYYVIVDNDGYYIEGSDKRTKSIQEATLFSDFDDIGNDKEFIVVAKFNNEISIVK